MLRKCDCWLSTSPQQLPVTSQVHNTTHWIILICSGGSVLFLFLLLWDFFCNWISCKLNKLIPGAETLKQRRWKPELTSEMLHCPPTQPLQSIEFNQLQLNLNKTSQPCYNAIAGLAKKSMYLVACSEKAQPSLRHSASHLFTRSTLQIKKKKRCIELLNLTSSTKTQEGFP